MRLHLVSYRLLTLKLVHIFNSKDEIMQEYKNDIITSSLLDIFVFGRTSVQIRDQIVAILTHYNTSTLNLDTQIIQPGYSRTIKQCLNIDQQVNEFGSVVVVF